LGGKGGGFSDNTNNAVNSDNTNNGQININSQNLNILSSQDTNNAKSNTKHKNLNVSYTVYGTNSGGLSGSISRANNRGGFVGVDVDVIGNQIGGN
jgi:hypothetical protein